MLFLAHFLRDFKGEFSRYFSKDQQDFWDLKDIIRGFAGDF